MGLAGPDLVSGLGFGLGASLGRQLGEARLFENSLRATVRLGGLGEDRDEAEFGKGPVAQQPTTLSRPALPSPGGCGPKPQQRGPTIPIEGSKPYLAGNLTSRRPDHEVKGQPGVHPFLVANNPTLGVVNPAFVSWGNRTTLLHQFVGPRRGECRSVVGAFAPPGKNHITET